MFELVWHWRKFKRDAQNYTYKITTYYKIDAYLDHGWQLSDVVREAMNRSGLKEFSLPF